MKKEKKPKQKSSILKKINITIGLLIIICGLIFAALPWIRAAYFNYIQNKLLDKWLVNPNLTPVRGDEDFGFGDDWVEDTDGFLDSDMEYLFSRMEGILTIEKINYHSPILRGVTSANLNVAPCVLNSSPEMGQIGNYCIAGHYSTIYGRLFNRLGELRKGDIIIVENGIDRYEYKVYDRFSVTPADTWVMGNDGDRKIITLITCDYSMKPMGRIIVKGELIEDKQP